ncbi:MAG: PP0621 family protein [Halothiobacillaceae bacterium]
MRYIILLALILGAILFYRRRRARGRLRRVPDASPPQASPAPPIRTVRCAECGLVLPEQESVQLNGRAFCSAQHVHRWQERHPR